MIFRIVRFSVSRVATETAAGVGGGEIGAGEGLQGVDANVDRLWEFTPFSTAAGVTTRSKVSE